MNAVLAIVCNVLFAACAPALVAVKFTWPKRISWWVVVLLAAILGWGLINLIVYFNQAHTAELVAKAGGLSNAPPELIAKWARDGGPKAFAILLGWVSGLIYLLPWIGVYAICQRIRARRREAPTIAA